MNPVKVEILCIDMYARGVVNTCPSQVSSLAHPELNGRKRNVTAKKQGKQEEKWNRTERDGTDNKTERDGNGAFFSPTVCDVQVHVHVHVHTCTCMFFIVYCIGGSKALPVLLFS